MYGYKIFDPANFYLVSGLPWIKVLKLPKNKWELLTNIDIFLMIEKETRGGIFYSVRRYAKTNKRYMKNYNQNKDENTYQA